MFDDRKDAGRRLGQQLLSYSSFCPMIVALPRGGVVVGYEVAQTLAAPLHIVVVRKIGAPDNRELGVGAIAEENVLVLDKKTMHGLGITKEDLQDIIQEETKEVLRRVFLYRHNSPLQSVTGRTIIVVDDGLATGVTAKAAIFVLRKHHPQTIIFAAPVCSSEVARSLQSHIEGVFCLVTPLNLEAIGTYYRNFMQVTDEEVVNLLKKAAF